MIDQSAIIDAGIKALDRVYNSIEKIKSLRPKEADKPGPPFSLVSNKMIARSLEDLCSSQSLAYQCLFDDGRRSTESNHFRNLRLQRVNYVKNICSGIDVTYLRNRGVRNALVHFDERLLKSIDQTNEGPWLQDLGLSHRNLFLPIPDFRRMVRVYIYDEDILVVLGETLKIIPLQEEILNIMTAFGLSIDRGE